MQEGVVLHTVRSIVDVASNFSALYEGPVQNCFIPALGLMDVRHHFQFYGGKDMYIVSHQCSRIRNLI